MDTYALNPIGFIRSSLKDRKSAPKQGNEGAPDVWIDLHESIAAAVDGLEPGQKIIVITWLHQGQRDILKVRPRSDPSKPLTGVFATRAPDRPNPLGLHLVTILEISGRTLKVGPLEAIDGTPVVDIKPVLDDAV